MHTGDPPLRAFHGMQLMIAAAAVFASAMSIPAPASAEDYACQGSEASSGHCYAVVEEIPAGIELNGSVVHIFTNNDYVPPLCESDKKLCDFVTNESWVVFNTSTTHWTEAGDFTGGDYGYETETPTDFAANSPVSGSFGFFVWPSGGPGQDSTNEVEIRYQGSGNYAINFGGRNVFNFGNDSAPYWVESGMEETDTRIKSEGAVYDMYLWGAGSKEYYWGVPGTEYLTPKNLSIICGKKFESEGKLIEQTFETTSTFGGDECN